VDATIEKVSIIVSKGSLEGIYPALIMASGAPAEGIEANLFFTFFGLDAVTRKRHEHIRSGSGAGLYGCRASCDLFGIGRYDLIDQVQDVITVGEFYAMAAGGQIVFT
jgi:peroxiredoxin family protein